MQADVVLLQRKHLDQLLSQLQNAGYQTVGPVVRDQAIVYDAIQSTADLPIGIGDSQEKGTYRLRSRDDASLFGYVVGPHSWKKYLFPPRQLLLKAEQNSRGLQITRPEQNVPKYALIGVRGCELKAIQIQDRVFLEGPYSDDFYRERRDQVFILAVNCTEPGNTCFCVSMDAGPAAGPGYDLAITEMFETQETQTAQVTPEPYYLARAGSAKGAALLQQCSPSHAQEALQKKEADLWAAAAAKMGRSLNPVQTSEVLKSQFESPHWQDVGERCLSCTNCTLVCPTCFCSGVQEVTDLAGTSSERWREWDSCFSLNFTLTAGRSIRQSPGARYRQWISHKLAFWQDQFDQSGCVGCGRCITWCPVGIDLTSEIESLNQLQIKAEENQHGN
jgi:ferredoxin